VEELFGAEAIKDDLLRMMFSCCYPKLREEAQVSLALNILCGFSVDETASAFVTSPAAMEKRLTRAKKTLARSKSLFKVADRAEFAKRLPAVLRCLYLLFNEGYHGASPEFAVRVALCREAMRLAALLIQHPWGAVPAAFALSALMCFDAARLPARLDPSGNLSSLFHQDRTLWDQELLADGSRLLELSASGTEATEYHIEAAIAAAHAAAPSVEETDWATIVDLYGRLMAIRPSPVVALNRAIAIAQQEGPERGLEEIGAIEHSERLANYPFYSAALGESELRLGRCEAAEQKFRSAFRLARNPAESRFFEQRLEESRRLAASGTESARQRAGRSNLGDKPLHEFAPARLHRRAKEQLAEGSKEGN
jgi:RNA polymerase sigma-70 factor (ECF subfamily)